jgi:long-chain acyl-CoA synthetase
VAVAGIPARRPGPLVNVNPLYTPRELEHQLRTAARRPSSSCENFAAALQQVCARGAVRHVVLAAMGDMLGRRARWSTWSCAGSRSWCRA